MSVQPNSPQQRSQSVPADSVQSIQPQPRPQPQPQPRVAVAEPWAGSPVTRQTSIGTLTFVGWADSGRHYEVWQDASGRQYVRNIGGNWYRGEDVAKAQAESQKMLQQLNVLETQYNPQLNSVTQRYFREGDKWFTLEYNPQSNSYTRVEVQTEKLQQDIFGKMLGSPSLNIQGYNIPGIEKYAVREPHAFTWYGPEYAVRYAKLREVFPELKNEEWITGADVWNVVRSRLEKYGWRPDTTERINQLQTLTDVIYNNPDAWKDVQADLDRQIRDFNLKLERFQATHNKLTRMETDSIKHEEEEKIEEYMNRLYGNQEHWFQVGTGQFGSSFIQWISSGFLGGPSQFQQKLYGALGILGSKANVNENVFRAGIEVARGISPASFLGTDMLGLNLPSVFGASLGLKNLVTGKASLSTGEKAYLKAVGRDITPENLTAYMVGSALGSGLAMYLQGKMIESVPEAIRFTKWEFTSNEALVGRTLDKAGIELKPSEFLSKISQTIEAKALRLGERAGLIEKEQYIPTEINADILRVEKPGSKSLISKVEFMGWEKAEDVIGKKVPEPLKAKPGEVSTIPVDIGGKTVNIPYVTRGEFGVAGGEEIAYTKEGLKLDKGFFVYGKGTGEESFLFTKMPEDMEKLTAPRYDFLKLSEAKISYKKIFEQSMGGTPKAVLYTEEMEKALGFSSSPRIPVMEKYTSPVKDLLPSLRLPLYLRPEAGKPKSGEPDIVEPKIPIVEDFKPDIRQPVEPINMPKPTEFQPVAPGFRDFVSAMPKMGDIVMPKIGQVAEPKLDTRVEPRIGDIAISVPKIEPKLEPPINIPVNPPPPPETRTLPRLPPIPISSGTRDIPVPNPARLWGRKEWLVEWFGPVYAPARKRTRRARKSGKRK